MEETFGEYMVVALLLIFSVVFHRLSRMMRSGALKPNALVGIRTARSCQSRESWYEAQSRCAPYVRLMAFICLDSAILLLLHIFIASIPIAVPAVLISVQMVVGVILLCYAASK